MLDTDSIENLQYFVIRLEERISVLLQLRADTTNLASAYALF